ncbi:NAD(FAD)-utilizing dehydrogenase [Ancylobacter defluvii]|uniref:NAD(FAD)-utilizing dehydrogenase n=2 Tax=Ancylobacter defluvii TaxID=1282440 RepID=A0A9W6K051_9HYPH|nr:TIGR03862 family flavoprotein [Ancylobacter defluvii]MBS7588932.1 TIGR03862 family flavoprotein [Ancylobacter defluvii]GLK84533.1 NAD(FAD)-utilizing dehydrogenase [Ancylobacter defluvii]
MTGNDSSFTARPVVSIIGAGPAGLLAAEVLGEAGAQVTVHDRMAAPARKFLMAGRGGLNLTHSEPRERFLARYGAATEWLAPMIDAFPPARLRGWVEGLGEPSFVGSSGRVFPKSFKASPLLRAWLRRLDGLGVTFAPRQLWLGWDEAGRLRFSTPEGEIAQAADATLLALGGASWPRLGTDGGWVPLLAETGAELRPLRPANAGVVVAWSEMFRQRFAGEPLKRIGLAAGGRRLRGEAVITEQGLEGGGIYALTDRLRDALAAGEAVLTLDLRPDLAAEVLAQRIAQGRKGESLSNRLRKAGLPAVALGLMREAAPQFPADPAGIAALAKAVPLRISALAGIERAISSAGGITRRALTDELMLRARPGVFAAGEMLDWEAPTGGYLLQGCFATGWRAATGMASRLGLPTPAAWQGNGERDWDASDRQGSEGMARDGS